MICRPRGGSAFCARGGVTTAVWVGRALSPRPGGGVPGARVGAAQVEVPGSFGIGVREMGGVGGGCDGNGITEAVMDVASPEARCEQTEGGHQATAVHAEQLVLVGDSQLEGAYRVDARDEVDETLRSAEQFGSPVRETNEHYRAHTAPLSGAHTKADQVRGWQRCFR